MARAQRTLHPLRLVKFQDLDSFARILPAGERKVSLPESPGLLHRSTAAAVARQVRLRGFEDAANRRSDRGPRLQIPT